MSQVAKLFTNGRSQAGAIQTDVELKRLGLRCISTHLNFTAPSPRLRGEGWGEGLRASPTLSPALSRPKAGEGVSLRHVDAHARGGKRQTPINYCS